MKNIWKLFVGDVRRLTSNIVSIIIVIGLVVIPGLFSWFNVRNSPSPTTMKATSPISFP